MRHFKNFLRILIISCIALQVNPSFAGSPLWQVTPAAGSNPQQIVPSNRSVIVNYIVTNLSKRARTLTIIPIDGIELASSCTVQPRGTAGATCSLNLLIIGLLIPSGGIFGGPFVCVDDGNGNPNTNLCFQPNQANILNIKQGPADLAIISSTPLSLTFQENTSGTVTVTNSNNSPSAARNIAPTIPSGSSITQQSTTCSSDLAIGDSCTITFTASSPASLTPVIISGDNTDRNEIGITVTETPVAEITSTPSNLSFDASSTGVVTVTNSAASTVSAEDITATIPSLSNISVQSTTCNVSIAPGNSCTITFTSAASVAATPVLIKGSNTNNTTVTITVNTPEPTISVSPSTLEFIENTTGSVIVSNSITSQSAAENVSASIPGGSNISVQTSTCTASLDPGSTCTITFTSASTEGPTTVPIAGTNTNSVDVSIEVVDAAEVSVSSPIQQLQIIDVGGSALTLTILNDPTSVTNANSVTVTNKDECPNVNVDDSDCTSISPGSTCNLNLTSNSPYIPCSLTIGGSNTINNPTALVAFRYLGGLVFEENGGTGTVVTETDLSSSWTASNSDINTPDFSNGTTNTNEIVANSACSSFPSRCAAQICRDLGPEYYLGALTQIVANANILCSNNAIPCNFGGFVSTNNYWGSNQFSSSQVRTVSFPSGNTANFPKNSSQVIFRCLRDF